MSEKQRKGSFEDHMAMVSQAHTKTAAVANTGSDMLSRLAAELGMTKKAEDAVAGGAAPTAEGEVSPAAATPAVASPAVLSATEAVAVPQAVIAGMSNEEQAAGDDPAGLVVATPVIGSGTGDVATALGFGRTDAATAAAATGANGGTGTMNLAAEQVEAEKVGRLMAHAFNDELNKMAHLNQYAEAVEILKQAGLLEQYNLKDSGIEKTAAPKDGFLDKIASNQSLTRDDMIGAACELIELQKQAELAAEEGREEARALAKLAEAMEDGEDDDVKETEEEKKAREAKEAAEKAAAGEGEKVAALMQNPQVVAAVKVLKQHNLL